MSKRPSRTWCLLRRFILFYISLLYFYLDSIPGYFVLPIVSQGPLVPAPRGSNKSLLQHQMAERHLGRRTHRAQRTRNDT